MNKLASSIVDAYTEGSAEAEFEDFRSRIVYEQVPTMTLDIIDAYRACRATEPEETAGVVSIVDLMTRVIIEDAEGDFSRVYAYAVADNVVPLLVARLRAALEADKASNEEEAYERECDADNLEALDLYGIDQEDDVHVTLLRVIEFLDAVKG